MEKEYDIETLIHYGAILTVIVVISQLFFTIFTILFVIMPLINWAKNYINICN